jgi:hypothetical protein
MGFSRDGSGKARLRPCRKCDASATVEERRLSAALSGLRKTGALAPEVFRILT